MDPEKKSLQTASNLKIGGALLLVVLVTIFFMGQGFTPDQFRTGEGITGGMLALFHFCRVIIYVLFIWGCVDYGRSKGYSGWFGLLGLLACFGLLALVLMPDKWPSRRY